ncbi:MAG: dihydrolipoyl dehydrogenase [Candidatus Dasytiphilus stammeri]
MGIQNIKTEVIVIGSGPAGYSAAFRCADLGLQTTLVERYPNLGGVCLNVGCIPSKNLLDISKFINKAKNMALKGIILEVPVINLQEIRSRKETVVNKLNKGLDMLAKMRNIKVLYGYGKFLDKHTITVNNYQDSISTSVKFDNAIIATGSKSKNISLFPSEDPRIWNSTDALSLQSFVPSKLLIIGGGIIGLEMATIYQSLGSQVEIAELQDQLIPGVDKNIIEFYSQQVRNLFKIHLQTQVEKVVCQREGIDVTLKHKNLLLDPSRYEAVLVAIGRSPNSHFINAELAGIERDPQGFIIVDKQMRTSQSHIYAVGDIIGPPMLAHKGIHEGHIAAEVIFGKNYYFSPKVIPCVAYTDPEIAWIGLTENEARAQGLNYACAVFPWNVLGRALACNCAHGITKIIVNKDNHRIIGGSIVGYNASELLGELGVAIEMGCDIEDLALTVHAHPTFSESLGMAAELFLGRITDLINSPSSV